MKAKNRLILLADELDKNGLEKYAGELDSILEEIAPIIHEHEGRDPASYMAKPQLLKIAECAWKMHKALKDGERLDDWMETYISQAELMVTSVHDKYFYEHKCKKCGNKNCNC